MSIRKDIELHRNELDEALTASRTSQSWVVCMPAGAPVTFELHADADEDVRYMNPTLRGGLKWTPLTQQEAEELASHIWDGRGLKARAMRVQDYLTAAIAEADHVLTLLPSDTIDN